MHPAPAFRSDEDWLALAGTIGFAHIFLAGAEGLMVVHAPVTRHGDRLRFHVSRANRIAPHLPGAAALVSVQGVDGYVSPNWYAAPVDQVPTWNYVAVEIDGIVAPLDEAELLAQLDELAAVHEPRVNPAAPWTRDKTDPARIVALLRGIVGFELTPTAIRGTRKLSQNKTTADRAGTVAGLDAAGNVALAAAMRS
ncbi:FMN-binding negative transcriptional regulator [Sphingomonas sp. KR1UV-12]|uniref:FMN-binding negative transcriptional regulator n=1 Tax=Sphingomonas aurea TaxID=3063994 RepID=A0ABT9EK46_9SPHN|nr:FMN-binding negative transcriptional regulator [Sphingomonas sp. KR1UV-12]MDP1027348.1 FMN-binding negative transcriptional regulator [Sphingomonas sp. KR1UV-12]